MLATVVVVGTLVEPEVLERLVADESPLPDETDTLMDVCREAIADGSTKVVRQYIETELQRGRSEIVCGLLTVILDHPNPALTTACLALAAGLPTSTDSGADIARRHHIDRSAVAQRVRLLRRQLGLPGNKGKEK